MAPSDTASTAVSIVGFPVIKITGTSRSCARTRRRNSTPDIFGIMMSLTITSNGCFTTASMATRPSVVTVQSYPAAMKRRPRLRAMSASSSSTRTDRVSFDPAAVSSLVSSRSDASSDISAPRMDPRDSAANTRVYATFNFALANGEA